MLGRMARQHILVLGAPRSGTTLLAALIGNHPDIAILHEVDRPEELKILGKAVVGNKLCISYNIDLERRCNPVLRLAYRFYPIGFWAHEHGYPFHHWSIRRYLAEVPDLQIFATLRDAESSIDSNQRNSTFSEKAARRWWIRSLEVLHVLHNEFPERLAIAHFDRIVTEPEAVTRALLDRLGLPFDQKVLEGFRNTPQYQGNKGIDGTKARWKTGEEIGVLRGRPDLIKAYNELLHATL